MKKTLIAAVLILGAVLLVALNSYSQVGEFYDNGYVLTDNNIQERLVTGKNTDPVLATEVHIYDPIYARGSSQFVGESVKKKLHTSYPVFINGGAGIKLLDGGEILVTSDFSTKDAYPNLIINEGVINNEDGSRAGWEEYIFVHLTNGLFMNSGFMYVDTVTNSYSIPSNSIISFEADAIRYYEFCEGFFRFSSIDDVDDDSVIRIGSVETTYGDLRKNLGIYNDESSNNSGFLDKLKNVFDLDGEEKLEEEEPLKKKKKKSTLDESEGIPEEPVPAEKVEAVEGAGAVDAVEPAAAGDSPSGSTEPAKPDPGEPPKPKPVDPGKKKDPEWKMPSVTVVGENKPGVYSLKTHVIVDDQAGVIVGGLTYEVLIHDEFDETTVYKRSVHDNYIQKEESQILVSGLKPETKFTVTGSFRYRDEYGNIATETIVFMEPYTFTTGSVSDLDDIYLESLKLDEATIFGDSITIPRIQFKQKSDQDAVGSMTRLFVRFINVKTGAETAVSMTTTNMESVKNMRAVAFSSGRIFEADQEYYVDIIPCDRYNNQLKAVADGAEPDLHPELKGHHGITHTCKLLPTGKMEISFDQDDLSQHFKATIDDVGQIGYTDPCIRIRDSKGDPVLIEGQEYLPLNEDGTLSVSSLRANRGYTAELFVTCDNNDGKGNVRRVLSSKSFVSGSLDLLGQLYVTVKDITGTAAPYEQSRRAVLSLQVNKDLTNKNLPQFVDRFTVSFVPSAGGSEVMYTMTDSQVAALREGSEVDIDTDDIMKTNPGFSGLKSNTKYKIVYKAYKVYSTEETGTSTEETTTIPVNATLTSLSTGLTEVKVDIKNRTVFEGYIGMNILVNDADDVIKGDEVLLYVYSSVEGKETLVGAFSIEKNKGYYTLRMASSGEEPTYNIPANTDFIFRFVAEEINTNKGTKFNYVFEEHTWNTAASITGRIYSGGLLTNGDDTYTATLYMDMSDENDFLQGEDKVIYVDKYRKTDAADEPQLVETMKFPYQDHSFDTKLGWKSQADGTFYDDDYVGEHTEEFTYLLPDKAIAEGYKQVEYIESTGNVFINTEVGALNRGYSLNVTYQTTTVKAQNIGGAIAPDNSILLRTLSSGEPDTTTGQYTNTDVNAKTTGYAEVTGTGSGSPVSIYLFAANRNGIIEGYSNAKIYSATIFDSLDGEAVRDFVPCIGPEPNNEPGLYDVVNEKFYSAMGTGSLKAGPEVLILSKTWSPKEILPDDLEQVEYIVGHGKEYIKTNIIPTNNTKTYVEYDNTLTKQMCVYGSRTSSSAKDLHAFWVDGESMWAQLGNNNSSTKNTRSTGRHTFSMSQKEGAYLDNKSVKTYTSFIFNSKLPIYLFCDNENGTAKSFFEGKLYEFSAWEDGSQIAHLVPVRNKETGAYGMYDTISGGEPYYNASTSGAFTGPNSYVPSYDLPDGYSEVEYIESLSAVNWINTGVKPTNNTRTVINYTPTNSNSAFGVSEGVTYNVTGGSSLVSLRFGKNTWNAQSQLPINNRYTIDFNQNKITVCSENGKVVWEKVPTATTFSCAFSMGLFARLNKSGVGNDIMTGRIYACQMYEGDELIRNFVPAFREYDCMYGFFDTVEKKFYENKGTGTFTGAKVPTKKRTDIPGRYKQIDYIESHGTEYIDTGFKGNTTSTRFVGGFMPKIVSGTYGLFGSRNVTGTANNSSMNAFIISSRFRADWTYGAGTNAPNTLAVNTPFYVDNSRPTLYLNGTRVSSGNSESVDQKYNFFIGNLSNGTDVGYSTGFIGYIYACQLYSDSALVRDLTPVYDTLTGEYGMYDSITGRFFGNAAHKGAFSGYSDTTYETLVRARDKMKFTDIVDEDSNIYENYSYEMYYVFDAGGIQIKVPLSSTSFTTESEIYTIATGQEFIMKSPNGYKYVVIDNISLDNTNEDECMVETCNAVIDFQGFSFDIVVNKNPIVNKISDSSKISNMVLSSYAPLLRNVFVDYYEDKYYHNRYVAGTFAASNYGVIQNVMISFGQESIPYLYDNGKWWSDLSPEERNRLQNQADQESHDEAALPDSATNQLKNSKYYTINKVGIIADNYGTIENFVLETTTPIAATVYASGLVMGAQKNSIIRNGYVYGSYNDDFTAEFEKYDQGAVYGSGGDAVTGSIWGTGSLYGSGAVAGYTNGKGSTIQNVYVLANMKTYQSNYYRCGAITGYNNGGGTEVKNSYSVGETYYLSSSGNKQLAANYGPALGQTSTSAAKNESIYYLSDFIYTNENNSITTLIAMRSATWQTNMLNSDKENKRFLVDEAVKVSCFPQLSFTSNCMPAQVLIPFPAVKGSSATSADCDVVYAFTYEDDPSLKPEIREMLKEHITGNWAWDNIEPPAKFHSDEQVACILISDKSRRKVYSFDIEGFTIKHEDILYQYNNENYISAVYVSLHDPSICKTNYSIDKITFELDDESPSPVPVELPKGTTLLAEFYRRINYPDGNTDSWSKVLKEELDRKSNTTLINLVLDADIDFSDNTMNEISWEQLQYCGKFDGNDHTISGIRYDDAIGKTMGISTGTSAVTTQRGLGLMGTINSGKVYDLTLENCAIEGADNVGILSPYSNVGIIESVFVKNSCASGGGNVGALIGYSDAATLTGCGVIGSKVLSSGDGLSIYAGNAGGMAGRLNESSTITRCFVQDTMVEGYDGHGAGGFSGTIGPKTTGVAIKGCYATGFLYTDNDFAGGFIGEIGGNNVITSCYSDVDIYTYGSLTGGFAGASKNGTFTQIASFGNISAASVYNLGSLAGGYTDGGTDERYSKYSLQALVGKAYAGTTAGAVFDKVKINVSSKADISEYNINRRDTAAYCNGATFIDYPSYLSGGIFKYLSNDYFETAGVTEGKLPKVVNVKNGQRTQIANQIDEYLIDPDNSSSGTAPLSIVKIETSKESSNEYTIRVTAKHKTNIRVSSVLTDFTHVDGNTGMLVDGVHVGMESITAHDAFTNVTQEVSRYADSDPGYTNTIITIPNVKCKAAYDTYWITGLQYEQDGQTYTIRVSERLPIEMQWKSVSNLASWTDNINGSHLENFKITGDIDFKNELPQTYDGTAGVMINRLVGDKGLGLSNAANKKAEYVNDGVYRKISNVYFKDMNNPRDKAMGWQTANRSSFIQAVTSELGNLEFNKVTVDKPYSSGAGIITETKGSIYGLRITNTTESGYGSVGSILTDKAKSQYIYLDDIKTTAVNDKTASNLALSFNERMYNPIMSNVTGKNLAVYENNNTGYCSGANLVANCYYDWYYSSEGNYQNDTRMSMSDVSLDKVLVEANAFGRIACACGLAREADFTRVDISNATITDRGSRVSDNETGFVAGYVVSGQSNITNCSVKDSVLYAPECNYVGGIVGHYATVKDCSVTNCQITGRESTGGIAGRSYVSATSAGKTYVDGCIINGTAAYVGGAVGYSYGSNGIVVKNTVVNNTKTGDARTGGVIGHENNNGSLYGHTVYNTKVTSSGNYTGGIYGYAETAYYSNCYAFDCEVRGKDFVGGISGASRALRQSNTVENCKIIGTGANIGGGVGRIINDDGSVANTYSKIDEGTLGLWVKNSYVYGNENVGGAAGSTNKYGSKWSAIVENCDIRGFKNVGGALGGYNTVGTNLAAHCYVTDTYISLIDDDIKAKYGITATGTGECFGGLFGIAQYADSDLVNNCIVNAPGANYVGGIAGRLVGTYNSGKDNAGLISKDCVVIGGKYVGGLFGEFMGGFNETYAKYKPAEAEEYRSKVRDSYSNALVYGNDKVAGIAGVVSAQRGVVTGVGSITTSDGKVYGLAPIIENCYFTGALNSGTEDSSAEGMAALVIANADVLTAGTTEYAGGPERAGLKLQGVASLPQYVKAKTVYPVLSEVADTERSKYTMANLKSDTSPQFVSLWANTQIQEGTSGVTTLNNFIKGGGSMPEWAGTLETVYGNPNVVPHTYGTYTEALHTGSRVPGTAFVAIVDSDEAKQDAQNLLNSVLSTLNASSANLAKSAGNAASANGNGITADEADLEEDESLIDIEEDDSIEPDDVAAILQVEPDEISELEETDKVDSIVQDTDDSEPAETEEKIIMNNELSKVTLLSNDNSLPESEEQKELTANQNKVKSVKSMLSATAGTTNAELIQNFRCKLLQNSAYTAYYLDEIPEPGYVVVSYIQSDGNQYIDTELHGNMGYRYELRYQHTVAGTHRVWGCFNQEDYLGGQNMSLTHTGGNKDIIRWTLEENDTEYLTLRNMDTNVHNLVMDDGEAIIDGLSKGKTKGHVSGAEFNNNAYLFTVNPGGETPSTNLVGRIYSYAVWDGSILLQKLIPVYDTENQRFGMYDLVNNHFHENKGSGAFTGGYVRWSTETAPITRYDSAVPLFEGFKKTNEKQNPVTGEKLYLATISQGVEIPGTEKYKASMEHEAEMYRELKTSGKSPVGPKGTLDAEALRPLLASQSQAIKIIPHDLHKLNIEIAPKIFTFDTVTNTFIGSREGTDTDFIQSVSYTLIPNRTGSTIISEEQKTAKTVSFGDVSNLSSTYEYNYSDTYVMNIKFETQHGSVGNLTAQLSPDGLRTHAMMDGGGNVYILNGTELSKNGTRVLYNVANMADGNTVLTTGGSIINLNDIGPVIGGQYVSVEYIQSSGQQYITTDYFCKPSTIVGITGQFNAVPTANGYWFGSIEDTNSCLAFYRNSSGKWAHQFGDGSAHNIASTYTVDANKHSVLIVTPDRQSNISGCGTVTFSYRTTKISTVPVSLFCLHNGTKYQEYASMKMYEAAFRDGEEVAHDYIPVYDNSSKKYGMYDLIGNQFYQSETSYAFTGPAVSD